MGAAPPPTDDDDDDEEEDEDTDAGKSIGVRETGTNRTAAPLCICACVNCGWYGGTDRADECVNPPSSTLVEAATGSK